MLDHPHDCTCGMHTHSRSRQVLRANARRKDPTNTTRIRVRFEQEVNRRFKELKQLIMKALVDADVMALASNAAKFNADAPRTSPRVNAATVPVRRAFEFLRSGDKVAAFMDWLKRTEDDVIFSIIPGTPIAQSANKAWTNIYIDSAYQRGLAQSAAALRSAGVKVSDRWLDSAFFRPVHADRVGLIYTRVFSDLAGITEVMDTQISRILGQGMAEGRSPFHMAREINKKVDSIGRTRARTLARTEVIASHAEASLNAYKEAGAQGVMVKAEWSTAGDDRVCPECEAMEGKEFDIDDAHGMIPLHPNCRCAFIPKVEAPERLELR